MQDARRGWSVWWRAALTAVVLAGTLVEGHSASMTIICPPDVPPENPVPCDQSGTNFTGVATATSTCQNGGPITISYSDDSDGFSTIFRTWTATDSCSSVTCTQNIAYTAVFPNIVSQSVVGSLVLQFSVEPSFPVSNWSIGDVAFSTSQPLPQGAYAVSGRNDSIIIDFSVFDGGKQLNQDTINLFASLNSSCAQGAFNNARTGGVPSFTLSPGTPQPYTFGTTSGSGGTSMCGGHLTDKSQYAEYIPTITGLAHAHADSVPSGALVAALNNIFPLSSITCASASNGSLDLTFSVQQGNAYFLGVDASSSVNMTVTVSAPSTPLTVSGITAADKSYDGNTSATLNTGSAVLHGIASGDSVTLIVAGATGTFSDKNVGAGKTVQVSGLTLGGANAGNYTLTQPTTTASITPKLLSVTGITAANKIYDGNTTAAVNTSGASLQGVVSGDTVSLNTGSIAAAFADKNVGTGKSVLVSGLSLSGAGNGNYTLAGATSTTANITARSLAVTAAGVNKAYDGTTSASVSLSDNRLSGDNLTTSYASASFADKNLGTAKPISVSGITLGGPDAGNYTLANTSAFTTANITARSLTVIAAGVNKAYDGTTSASVSLSDNRLSGDNLTTSYASASFADKNLGTAKPIAVSGITLGGPDAGNYTLANTSASAAANITAGSLTVSAAGVNKAYDGTTSASVSLSDNRLPGDNLSTSYANATFADKNVATGKPVTASGLSLGGTDAANYSLANSTVATTADITPRSLVVAVSAANKTYDGTTVATVTFFDNRLPGDTLVATASSASFSDKNVGANKTVTVSGISLSGPDGGNYTLNSTGATATASIIQRGLTITATSYTKDYDGTVAATAVPTITSGTLQGFDTANFVEVYETKEVGEGKALIPSGIVNDGNGGNNYAYTFVSTNSGTIRALPGITLAGLVLVGNTFTVPISSSPGVIYILEYKNSLTDQTWIQADQQVGTGGPFTLHDTTATGLIRFYRFRIP